MKKIAYSSLFLVMITITAFSQPVTTVLPTTAAIIHYKLSVGYNTTTVLIFPATVKQADRGERDLLAQKQPGVENVLKVKAARKDFAPTNLHVFTADGRIYAFDVTYTADPPQTTYDLSAMDTVKTTTNQKDLIEYSQKEVNKEELATNAEKARQLKPFLSTTTRKYRMKLQLQAICRLDDLLFFSIDIANRSNLPYDIDFVRLYIRDMGKMRRSSIQQREIAPVYKDSVSIIPGNASLKWVVAVPKFTIPDHRKFVLEVYERGGGRHLMLEVKNRQLFQARALH